MTAGAWWFIASVLGPVLGTLGLFMFLDWLTRQKPGKRKSYQGHNPAIPPGAYRLPVGSGLRPGDRVWGFDGWYKAPEVEWSVKPGEFFIRRDPEASAHLAGLQFWVSPDCQPGHPGKTNEEGYASLQ
jgi:hypothetical protein